MEINENVCWEFQRFKSNVVERNVVRMEESRSPFKILIGKPTGKTPLGRPRSRWEDNIRMDFKEIGIDTSSWVDSAQDMDYCRALVNAALDLRVP